MSEERGPNSNDTPCALLYWLDFEEELIHNETTHDNRTEHPLQPQHPSQSTQGRTCSGERIASQYQLDGIHLNPAYIHLLDAAADQTHQ